MGIDLGVVYRQSRERIGALVEGADPDRVVPATPEWSVHDVVAHLAGVVEDVTTGNLEGAATNPWTAAQVARSRDLPVADLLARWAEQAPVLEGVLSSPQSAMAAAAAFDVVTHELDLAGALGAQPAVPDEVITYLAGFFRDGFAAQVAEAGLAPVTVVASDREVLRSRLGRRTRDEARALQWSADPEPYLDLWFRFGPAERSLNE